jgi:hypothetical protein
MRSRVPVAQICVHNGVHVHGSILAYTLDDTRRDIHGGRFDDA